ncbi:MAG TPA: hypothetical protein VJ835_10570 [Fimbriimonadaceae bacterium]|nr:hypothetical protein [Fimbriimonadaceae bacterium]
MDAIAADALNLLQTGASNKWDGKSDVKVADLDDAFRNRLVEAFAEDWSNLGFQDPDAARSFIMNGRISGLGKDVMVRWATVRQDGTPFHQGFVLSAAGG